MIECALMTRAPGWWHRGTLLPRSRGSGRTQEGWRVKQRKRDEREPEAQVLEFSVGSLLLRQSLYCQETFIYPQPFNFLNPGNSKMCTGREAIFVGVFLWTAELWLFHSSGFRGVLSLPECFIYSFCAACRVDIFNSIIKV